ncbi:hypothetical protein QC760_005135 [Botrytis cinerea]
MIDRAAIFNYSLSRVYKLIFNFPQSSPEKLIQVSPFYLESPSVATGGNFLEPRLYQRFRIWDCGVAKETAISVAVAEVPQVVSISASMEGKRSSNKYATSS